MDDPATGAGFFEDLPGSAGVQLEGLRRHDVLAGIKDLAQEASATGGTRVKADDGNGLVGQQGLQAMVGLQVILPGEFVGFLGIDVAYGGKLEILAGWFCKKLLDDIPAEVESHNGDGQGRRGGHEFLDDWRRGIPPQFPFHGQGNTTHTYSR